MKGIAAALSFGVALAVFQATDRAAAAVETFRPSADAYVNEARPHRDYESAGRLHARAGSRPEKQVYLRFSVGGLSGPVTRAILLVDHGSQLPEANRVLDRIAGSVRARLPDAIVEVAQRTGAAEDSTGDLLAILRA